MISHPVAPRRCPVFGAERDTGAGVPGGPLVCHRPHLPLRRQVLHMAVLQLVCTRSPLTPPGITCANPCLHWLSHSNMPMSVCSQFTGCRKCDMLTMMHVLLSGLPMRTRGWSYWWTRRKIRTRVPRAAAPLLQPTASR